MRRNENKQGGTSMGEVTKTKTKNAKEFNPQIEVYSAFEIPFSNPQKKLVDFKQMDACCACTACSACTACG